LRDSWDTYFMRLAEEASRRSTCPRRHVVAVVVVERSVIVTGYNGSIRGLPHCEDVGCLMVDGHCERTVHAEANAVAQAARNGSRLLGSTLYVTAYPCWNCFRLVANAGVAKIVYRDEYKDRARDAVAIAMNASGIEMERL